MPRKPYSEQPSRRLLAPPKRRLNTPSLRVNWHIHRVHKIFSPPYFRDSGKRYTFHRLRGPSGYGIGPRMYLVYRNPAKPPLLNRGRSWR